MHKLRLFVFIPVLLVAGAASAQDWGDRLQQFMGAVTDSRNTRTSAPDATQMPASRVAEGLKAALADGAAWAVSQLGRKGGFWSHPARRIPLPDWLDKASFVLQGLGLSHEIKQLHVTMNRAAEQAVAEVGPIVRETISNMSMADAYAILHGGEHAATRYLRRHAGEALADRIRPIVADATAQSTAARRYQKLVSRAEPLLALAPVDINPDLNSYVTHQALDVLFSMIAEQEAQIRANPLAYGSDLLRAVFGDG